MASCKACGEYKLMEKGSCSSSLHTAALELASLINSDMPWTKVSKGHRSSLRRPRSSVDITLKACGKLVDTDSERLEMPVSESEKLGVSVLGCHFNEKVKHVPIKKRRFLFRAPSPSQKSPICSEESERHAASLNASSQNADNSCLPSISVLGGDICQTRSSYNNIGGKSFAGVYERTCEDEEDFSGISILAAAACCISLGVDEDCGMAPGAVLFEKGSLEAPIADESKEDLVNCANLSTDECGSCLSTAPSNTTTSSTMYAPSPDTPIFDGSSSQLHEVVTPVILQSKTDLEECKKQECFARDDRLHWDLNTVMDAWEQPFEHQDTNSSAADRNVKQTMEENVFKGANWDSGVLGRERGGTYSDIKKTVPSICLKDMPNEIEVSMMEEYKFDHCAGIRGAVMFEEKLQSPKTAGALNVMVKGAKSSHDEHGDSVDGGSLCGVPSKHIPIHPASAAIANSGNLNCRSNDDYPCGEVGMDFMDDCSPPPGFDNFINVNAPKRIFRSSSVDVGCRNDINEPTSHIPTSMTIFSEKQNLSPTYLPFPENGARGSVNSFTEGDDEVRRNSPLMTMKNLVSEGTVLLQESIPFCLVEDISVVESSSNVGKLDILESPAAPHVHLPVAIVSGEHASISAMCDAAETDPLLGIGAENIMLSTEEKKSTTMCLGPPPVLSHDGDKKYSCDHESFIKGTKLHLDNSYCNNNFLSEHELGNKTEKLDENSAECDSQYEDGELRESNMRTWQDHDGEDGIAEYGPDNKGAGSNLGVMDAEKRGYQYCPQESSETRVSNPGCSRESDLIANAPCFYVLLPEKVHSGDRGSDLGPSGVISGSGNKVQNDSKDSSLSAEWKLNLSSWNMHTESRRSSSGVVTTFRGCSSRKVSSRDDEHGMEPEDMDIRGNGSSFYRRESLSHFRGLSSHDSFRSRDRVRMQECSSRDAERWCRYSPTVRTSGRSSYTWNHCSESARGLKRLHSPSFQYPPFNRSGTANVASVDKSTKEGVVEPSDAGRQTTSSSSHTHRSFRSRSPTDRQDMHVGYQPNGDMSHNRFMSTGRGRSVRYVSRFDGGGPKRYHGPPSDDCPESSLEFSHRFSRRRRCFSPIERRGNPYGRHRSISRSPSRSRTRSPIRNYGFRRRSSRSPNFRSEVRLRRPRSPSRRHGFEADHVTGYTSGPRNHTSPPPNSRWLDYKQRSSVFDRRSPGRSNPQGGIFGYNDSPRKVKHNDYYRYGPSGRFSDINEVGRDGPRIVGNDDDRMDRGFRRGPIRHRDMDDTVKGFCYDYEDISLGYPRNKDASEYHGRRNPKFNNAIDTRISDFPRSRPREEREPLVDDRDAKNNLETKVIEARQDGEDVASVSARPS